jgi:hypothetical protein
VIQAYKALGWISLGLKDGRNLALRPQDYVPPSCFATSNGYNIAEWLKMGTVELVPNADSDRLAQSEAAFAPQPGALRTSLTVDGLLLGVTERSGNYRGDPDTRGA